MSNLELTSISYNCLLDLATPDGINASGQEDRFGCIFGRDTAITILKILRYLERNPDRALLDICRRSLATLAALQGKETNLESGEEPGKFIHEYRQDKFESLVNNPRPWFVYPDGKLRNYDSIDSTPLALIAIYRYWQMTGDKEFLDQIKPAVDRGLEWLTGPADKDTDHLIEYELPALRVHGGLTVQSWTDSRDSLAKPDGTLPPYPIAPVEAQGYLWLALKMWGRDNYASLVKTSFNQQFIFDSIGYKFPAQALDGHKKQIETVTGNSLLLLWASWGGECVLEDKYVPDLVKRSFLPDLFDPDAGIRTMSLTAPTFNPRTDSYHNGSFWPKLNGLSGEGLENWGYKKEADSLRDATIKALTFFETPIELYIKNNSGGYQEYTNSAGQVGCRRQAWSAAVALDFLTE